jgi:hypothetical protein
MKNAVFLDVMPRDSCKYQRCGGTCRFLHQGGKSQRAINNARSDWQLLEERISELGITLAINGSC